MTKYSLWDFRNWLNEPRNSQIKNGLFPSLSPSEVDKKWKDFLIFFGGEKREQDWGALGKYCESIKDEVGGLEFNEGIKKWMQEVDSAEKKKEIVCKKCERKSSFQGWEDICPECERGQQNSNDAKRFFDWLEEDPNRKQNLSRWGEWKPIIDSEEIANFPRIIEMTQQWDREEKTLEYWRILKKWIIEVNGQDPTFINTLDSIFTKIDEFRELKFKNEDLEKNNSEVSKRINEIYQELNHDKPDLEKVKKELLEIQIKDKKRKLEQLKTTLKSKLDENLTEWLETLLEAKIALTQTNIPFIRNQFNKAQEKLSSILNEEEINNFCEIQVELSKLEREWESYQAEKMEAKMEV